MNVPKFGIGASALRKEDFKLIRGEGNNTDDLAVGSALHGFVWRSSHAHSRFKIISTEAALAAPGVHLVLTDADNQSRQCGLIVFA